MLIKIWGILADPIVLVVRKLYAKIALGNPVTL